MQADLAQLDFSHLLRTLFHEVIFVARSKQTYIEWMEATVLLSIYLSSELILTGAKDSIGQVSFG
jgi:hypothetical protein